MLNNNKTILIVDDDFDFLNQQKMILESEGFNIITSDSVNNTRKILKNTIFDLAIVDLMMEHSDSGFILSYELKKERADIPIIMVTAVSSQTGLDFDLITDTEKQWIKADTIMTKPVRSEQLLKEVKKLLQL